MRRAKLGDVYTIQVAKGYKLYQWAYDIPNWGKYIRVFKGLYQTVPNNIAEIVQGDHEYIIGFEASRAYRIRLAEFVENVPVPNEYPFPQYRIAFRKHDLDDDFRILIRPTPTHPTLNVNEIFSFDVHSVTDLPSEFRNVKLEGSSISPSWLMFLFDYGFSFDNLRSFYPELVLGENKGEVLDRYQMRVDKLLKEDQLSRKKKPLIEGTESL